jgi:hypothetical protein
MCFVTSSTAVSRIIPVGMPLSSTSTTPPCTSLLHLHCSLAVLLPLVAEVVSAGSRPAMRSAALFATPMWQQLRYRNTGRSAHASSMSCREGYAPPHILWSQPSPIIQESSGCLHLYMQPVLVNAQHAVQCWSLVDSEYVPLQHSGALCEVDSIAVNHQA